MFQISRLKKTYLMHSLSSLLSRPLAFHTSFHYATVKQLINRIFNILYLINFRSSRSPPSFLTNRIG